MKKIRKIFIRLLLISIILLVTVVSALLLYGYFYGDRVKQLLVSELNKQLNVKVQVSDIRFSMLNDFPKASVRLFDIKSEEDLSGDAHPLIHAGEISLQFNIRNMLSGKYSIDRISLNKAFLNLVVTREGKTNFKIFKTEPDAKKNSSVEIDLKNVILRDVEISYYHAPASQEYLFRINRGQLKGTFAKQNNELTFTGDLYSNHIRSGETEFLRDTPLSLSLDMTTDNGFENIQINRGKVEIKGMAIAITGDIKTARENRALNLQITADESDLSTLFTLIPPIYLKPVESYQMNGRIALSAKINGPFSGNHLPAILVDFQVNNGTLIYPNTAVKLHDIALQGSFENGSLRNKKSFKLLINDFTAGLDHSNIRGSISVVNFEQPEIETRIQSTVNLTDLKELLSSDTIVSMTGRMDLDLRFKNRLKGFRKFTIHDFISSNTSGSLNIRQANFNLKGSPLAFKDFEGDFRFNNKDLVIEQFSGRISDNDFSMEGRFSNVLAWAFLPDQRLYIGADVQSDNIDLDQLLEYPGGADKGNARLRFSGNVNYNINVSVGQFHFRKFSAEQISGNLIQTGKFLELKNGHFSSMKGTVDISGYINGNNPDQYDLHCVAHTTDVNIRELFAYFGNFGQDNLTAEQLNGTVTAQTEYTSHLTPDLYVDPASVSVVSDIMINNGELISYTPLYKLSGFIEKEELRHIRFDQLNNQIVIADKVIRIPHMTIASSSLDLELSGTHTFDNIIDYHVKLRLADVINRNRNKEPQTIGNDFVSDREHAEPNLFLSLSGNAADPAIKYDTKAVKDKIAGDLAKEKETFKEILKKEFGPGRNNGQNSGVENLEKNQSGKDFILGWDETKADSTQAARDRSSDQKSGTKEKPKKKDFIIQWDEEKDTIR